MCFYVVDACTMRQRRGFGLRLQTITTQGPTQNALTRQIEYNWMPML